MTPSEIPQEVKEQIEASANERHLKYSTPWIIYVQGAEWMYRLMQDQAPYIFGPERTKKPK